MENMMADGIRSYGPGKFYTILDSYVYEVTMDGGADEEASYEEGAGWYGLVWLTPDTIERIHELADEQDDKLTREEDEQLEDNSAVILFERSDGIVEADWYEDENEAQKVWDEIEAEVSGADDPFTDDQMYEGYVISDARGGGYEVTHEGKFLGTYDDMGVALGDIERSMGRAQFWPNVYYVNERGNIDLLDADGNIIESRV